MAFIWRRRSTSIVKIIAVLTAIWFFVAFFIYTDDTRRETASNKWSAMSQQLKSLAAGGSGNANNQIDNFERDGAGVFEAGGGFGVGNNVVLERNNNAQHGGGGGNEIDDDDDDNNDANGEGVAADVPIAQPDEPNNAGDGGDAGDIDDNADINEGDESILNNVVVHPNDKYRGKKGNSNEKSHQAVDDGKSRTKNVKGFIINIYFTLKIYRRY
ncbi:putative polypeptide N-acetylgalactosaminyltransferase 9 [Lucilia cuprina]|uniref:putative polypeptide N-acetylgalactosaminyltransferase 9 n=1 Tax=Lucilia cuprina TaxID=7375 RepID=UPI001F05202F|nr:putative polypeptide N-acetylgalactosaminyltransferase 9 [Lucilia cuprina]